jgi:cysteine synthase A
MSCLEFINPEHVDGYAQVSDAAAMAAARELARVGGVFAGFSTGANLAAAGNCWPATSSGKPLSLWRATPA